jgi:hypothetical protein
LALYQRVLGRLRAGHGTRVAELAEITSVRELEFFAGIADHDPVAALEKLTCPIPAICGADDVLVPTQASVNAYQAGFARSGHQRCGRCQRP